MLKELRCVHFSHSTISFHAGLNVVLGDDDARNSIGKSTVLMVIDFVLGGSTFLADDAGVIREFGHHSYEFAFEFNQKILRYSRSTDLPDTIYTCDENYQRIGECPIEDYRRLLKFQYNLTTLDNSFRSIVGPYLRIWRKGGLDPNQPFVAALKEASAVAIGRLIDLFEHTQEIAAERKLLEDQKDRRILIKSSMSANIIPKINKVKRDENTKLIAENAALVDQLKQGFGGALNVYESLFDEQLRRKQIRKNELIGLKAYFQNKIDRLEREISGITPRLAANISLLSDFFPAIDVERLEQVESFHQKIGSTVKKELKDELAKSRIEERAAADEIHVVDSEIQAALKSKGMPDDIFQQVLELKDATDKATEENKHYDRKIELDETIEAVNARLEKLYSKIFLDLETSINLKLRAFNTVVYGPSRASSELRIKSANSYQFTSPADSGTGTSYAGLIGFDLAMLSLTRLPIFIHDSIIYKNIQVQAVRRILRILAAVKSKQIFISFDEGKKYGGESEKLLKRFTVLKLAHNDLLYRKDWRDRKITT